MYLVIREITGKNKKIQKPIRLYENAHSAYEYVEQYMKESSGKIWHKIIFTPLDITTNFIKKQQWYRTLKNGDTEHLKIQYMKTY